MTFRDRLRLLALTLLLAPALPAAAASASAAEAEQLRVVQAMSEQLRARIDRLPVLLPKGQPVSAVETKTLVLNQDPVIVDGQRFDGVVITTPAAKATFAWAFVTPANLASWYILREKGEMKGFSNFLQKPRPQVPGAEALKPADRPTVTLQKLDSSALAPNERYVLWFRFKDDAPAEMTLRAAFVSAPSLSNNRIAPLLFVEEKKP